jgi:protein ImuB
MTRVELDTFSSLIVLPRSRPEEVSTHAVMLECAGAFSPRVEDHSDGCAFLCMIDIAGTEKLLGPPEALARELLHRVRVLGVSASVAISRNFYAALSYVRGSSSRVAFIAPGNEGPALAPLPLKVLDISSEHAETFALWGVRTLGAMAALPEKELISRIGQEGRRLRQLARGEPARKRWISHCPRNSRVATPQGFTTNENKGDIMVFHSIPHAIPHTRNKDSYLDLLRTSFWGNLGR